MHQGHGGGLTVVRLTEATQGRQQWWLLGSRASHCAVPLSKAPRDVVWLERCVLAEAASWCPDVKCSGVHLGSTRKRRQEQMGSEVRARAAIAACQEVSLLECA